MFIHQEPSKKIIYDKLDVNKFTLRSFLAGLFSVLVSFKRIMN